MAHYKKKAVSKHMVLFGWFCIPVPVVVLGESLVLHLHPAGTGDLDMIAISYKDGVHLWLCIEWRCEESSCSHVFLGDGELPWG